MNDGKNPFAGDVFRELTAEERAALIAKAKEKFSAADLQRFTEIEEDIPIEDVLKELQELERRYQAEKP